jgi:hypothetical protein
MRTCMWHRGEGMLHHVDRHAHGIRLFHIVRRSDQLQAASSGALQLCGLLSVPRQTGNQRIQSARADRGAVLRSSWIRDLLK